MSEEDFLIRWSRRKREAGADSDRPGPPSGETQQAPSPAVAEGGAAEPEIDLSALPLIDSITAATDITAFLRKGIPAELTRAALRRAWTTDPTIRDFVGLAENAWDFTDPNAMPGFGPLDCSESELSALVDRIVGGVRKAAESLPQAPMKAEESAVSGLPQAQATDSNSPGALGDRPPADRAVAVELSSAYVAPQPVVATEAESGKGPVRRRAHGGALPR